MKQKIKLYQNCTLSGCTVLSNYISRTQNAPIRFKLSRCLDLKWKILCWKIQRRSTYGERIHSKTTNMTHFQSTRGIMYYQPLHIHVHNWKHNHTNGRRRFERRLNCTSSGITVEIKANGKRQRKHTCTDMRELV